MSSSLLSYSAQPIATIAFTFDAPCGVSGVGNGVLDVGQLFLCCRVHFCVDAKLLMAHCKQQWCNFLYGNLNTFLTFYAKKRHDFMKEDLYVLPDNYLAILQTQFRYF